MNMINLLDVVTLTRAIPKYDLKSGDSGTVVYMHKDGEAFEVEFLDSQGYTKAVICVQPNQIKKVNL